MLMLIIVAGIYIKLESNYSRIENIASVERKKKVITLESNYSRIEKSQGKQSQRDIYQELESNYSRIEKFSTTIYVVSAV